MNNPAGRDLQTPLGARAGFVGALCLAASAVLGGCAPQPYRMPALPSAPAVVMDPAPAVPVALTPAQIAARAIPAVVAIRGERSMGTGFIVRRDGWIATNRHVIVEQRALTVTIPGRGELPVVDVVVVDADHDIAIIRVEADGLPVLPLGNSGRVRPGDPVVAIGHPLGYEDTISNGLVSAVRQVDASLTIFQISAPIAPGSSGGPLIDDQGQVIGVSTATSTQGQNINFGMPIGYLAEALAHPSPVTFAAFVESQLAPVVEQEVPQLAVAILKGCGDGDLMLLRFLMTQALVESAAPYGRGDFATTYQVTKGASVAAERRLGPTCTGPRRVLAEARQAAARVEDPKARAWALRDGLVGLIEVLERRLDAGSR